MPPQAVVEKGLSAVETYLQDVRTAANDGVGIKTTKFLKVVFVGSSGAGKTRYNFQYPWQHIYLHIFNRYVAPYRSVVLGFIEMLPHVWHAAYPYIVCCYISRLMEEFRRHGYPKSKSDPTNSTVVVLAHTSSQASRFRSYIPHPQPDIERTTVYVTYIFISLSCPGNQPMLLQLTSNPTMFRIPAQVTKSRANVAQRLPAFLGTSRLGFRVASNFDEKDGLLFIPKRENIQLH